MKTSSRWIGWLPVWFYSFFPNWMYKQMGGGRENAINNADGTLDSLTFYFNQFVSLKSWQKIFSFPTLIEEGEWTTLY